VLALVQIAVKPISQTCCQSGDNSEEKQQIKRKEIDHEQKKDNE
jgi:hypothetical protein